MVKKPEEMSLNEKKVSAYDEGKKIDILQQQLEESEAMQKLRQCQRNKSILDNMIALEEGGKE